MVMFRRCLSFLAVAVAGLGLMGQVEAVKFEMTAKAYPETSESPVRAVLQERLLTELTVAGVPGMKNGKYDLGLTPCRAAQS